MTVRLLADDLTGALDAAVRLVARAGELPVTWDAAAAINADGSLALVTPTRDGPAEDAVAAIAALKKFWRADALAFKKIDSLWRGNTLPEMIALIEGRVFATVIIATAFPEQNRITREGRQYWRRTANEEWQLVPVDLRGGLAARGIAVNIAARGEHPSALSGVWMFDAERPADLDAIAELGRTARGPVLWVGAAGLAGALGGAQRSPMPTRIERPVTMIVGTNHLVSRAQVEAIAVGEDASVFQIGVDAAASDDLIARAAAQAAAGQSVVFWFSPDAELAPAQAEAAMNAFLQRLVERYRPPGTLLVTGGETLFRLCRAAGATRLLTGAEIAPGIATATFADGRWGGLSLVSKSGAFGAPGFLSELLRKGSL
jgi:uncharacterized protein YgbK (DUF1537 family)